MAGSLIAVCVFDRAAQSYATPMFFPAIGLATRAFTDQVNRREDGNSIYTHPSDFELYQVGEFDQATGEMKKFGPDLVLRAEDVAVR